MRALLYLFIYFFWWWPFCRCEVILHCVFGLHFPDDHWCQSIFSCVCVSSLQKCICRSSAHFLFFKFNFIFKFYIIVLVLPNIKTGFKPCWFSKLDICRLIFPVLDPQAGEFPVGIGFLAPLGELCSYEFSLVGGSPCWGRGSRLDLHLLLLPFLLFLLLYIFSYEKSLLPVFRSSSNIVVTSGCNFGISMGGDELRIFLLHCLVSDPRRRLCDGNVLPFIMFM